MPRNAQGLYTLPAGNPVISGTEIESVWANTTMDDLAAAITGSLPRDGSAPMTGPLTLNGATPTAPRHAVDKQYLEQFLAYATGMPVGAVFAFAAASVPTGYLLCNGQAVSRTTYSVLFGVIGTTYGSGDGASTFNVPDLRGEFVRGRPDDRGIGSKQVGSFAAHTHPVSDPGHTHGASQVAHTHTANHNHGVTDPGHTHTTTVRVGADSGAGDALQVATVVNVESPSGRVLTNSSGTGVSVNVATLNTGSTQPAITVASAVTGETIGSTGGTETRPQNIALDYYIKAEIDSSGGNVVISIESSDVNMIAIDETNPAIPVLDIKSNVAFGTVKLDSAGQIPVNLMPTTGVTYQGQLDASSGNLPIGAFVTGDFYNIAVGGTLSLMTSAGGPVPTVVVVGDQIIYDESIAAWWYNAASAIASIAAAAVTFVPHGTIAATNAQSAIEELDAEKLALSGGTMTGALKNTASQIGTSATATSNFSLEPTSAGSMRLARGDAGATTQDIMTVDSGGTVGFSITPVAPGFIVANGSPDGGDIRFLSDGNQDWTIDNSNGELRVFGSAVPGLLAMKVGLSGGIGMPIAAQIGTSAIATNNFSLAPTTVGAMKLARGNAGATTQDIMTVLANGQVAFDQMPTLIANPGYITLPGGLLVQWGLQNTSIGGLTVTFPKAFSTLLFAIAGQGQNATPGVVTDVGIGTRSASSMTIQCNPNVATNVGWLAIGTQ